MATMEKKTFDYINKFRQNPGVIKSTLQKLVTTITRITPKSPMIKPYNELASQCNSFPKRKPIRLSEELSKAARDFLEAKLQKKDFDEVILEGKSLANIVEPSFITDNCALILNNGFDSPDAAVYKLLCNPSDKKKIGNKYLLNPEITQIGIAIHEAEEREDDNDDEEEEDSYICFIFDKNEVPTDLDFTIDGVDLSELRKAFEIMDYEHKNKLKIKEVLKALEEQGKNESEPTLFQILTELDTGKEYVTWPEFAKHCNDRMSDKKTEKGKKTIFNIFLPNEKYETIDYSELKELNKYLELGYTDKEIQTMLKMSTQSKMGISYEDYVERLKNLENKK